MRRRTQLEVRGAVAQSVVQVLLAFFSRGQNRVGISLPHCCWRACPLKRAKLPCFENTVWCRGFGISLHCECRLLNSYAAGSGSPSVKFPVGLCPRRKELASSTTCFSSIRQVKSASAILLQRHSFRAKCSPSLSKIEWLLRTRPNCTITSVLKDDMRLAKGFLLTAEGRQARDLCHVHAYRMGQGEGGRTSYLLAALSKPSVAVRSRHAGVAMTV
jgi:hypothetical protein